jgi:hypothetical protein
MVEQIASIGPLINQSLSAAIATIAASFFLYSLVKGINNQVARVYSLMLFFVLVTYTGDLGLSYIESPATADSWLRVQWLGIAFVPAAYVHMSHAILTMTGLPSRGRRRWVVRGLYVVAAIFLALVLMTDFLVRGLVMEPAPHFEPGPGFPLFVLYFVGSVILSVWFVWRARRRMLAPTTRRRMTQLLFPYLAPALAVFPFLLISGRTLTSPPVFYGVLIVVDAALAVMLTYMAYAMAFMGTLMPERFIKAQMLQFFLRGPVVAIATLAVVVWTPRAGAFLGMPGDEVMPLLAATTILLMQWLITLARPHLEGWLIYTSEQAEFRQIQQLEERLITGADFHQTLDTILAAICDYLRVESAFVASVAGDEPKLERAIGLVDGFGEELAAAGGLSDNSHYQPSLDEVKTRGEVFEWQGFWLIPLYTMTNGEPRMIGLLGVGAPAPSPDRLDDDQWQVLMALATRASEVLDDRRVQSQVFASLEGLLPGMTTIERLREANRHTGYEGLIVPTEELISSPDFEQTIKDALSHYWGGPQLTDSALLKLGIVRRALEENDGNPQRAVRAVLTEAVENLRPEGQRSMTTAEWILYNILEMRFIQGRKVRDVAMRLAMSESDLYRKQRIAVEAVAGIVADMERAAYAEAQTGSNGDPLTVNEITP